MKKVLLILAILTVNMNIAFSQSAIDNVRSLAESKDYVQAKVFIPQAIMENKKDFDFMVLAGDIYLELDNLDSALIMYKKADDINDDQPKVMRKIALTLSALDKHNEAIEEMKDAIDEDEKDVYNYLALGKVYLQADSMKQAELYITKAREMNKDIPDAYIALGDLYFAQKIYELAKTNYEDALSIDEKNVEARTKLAISYYWLANREYDNELANELFKKSLKEWNTITQQDPKNAKAFFEQGKILFFSGIWDKSAKSLYKYIQLRPSGKLGRWYLAQSLYELTQCDSAEPHLIKSAEMIDSVKTKALLLLARCYFDAQKYDKSIATFEKLKDLDTLDSKDLERLGAAEFSVGDTLKAIETYRTVIDKDPSKCKLAYKTGVMYYFIKHYDDAIDVFKQRLKNCDDQFNAKCNFFIGISYFLNAKPDSSLGFFKKSYALDTTDYKSIVYLADAYASMKEYDSAAANFGFVITNASADPSTNKRILGSSFGKLAGMYLRGKKYNKMKKICKNWVEILPESANGYFYLGVSYQATQDLENACKNYKKALKFNPNLKFAKQYFKKLNCQ